MKGKDELGKDFPNVRLFDHVSERFPESARSRDERAFLSELFIFSINHDVAKISSLTILHHDMGFSRSPHQVDEADDVRMLDSPQQLDLVKYILLQRSSDGFYRNVLVWVSIASCC